MAFSVTPLKSLSAAQLRLLVTARRPSRDDIRLAWEYWRNQRRIGVAKRNSLLREGIDMRECERRITSQVEDGDPSTQRKGHPVLSIEDSPEPAAARAFIGIAQTSPTRNSLRLAIGILRSVTDLYVYK
jgi:hypothetical protein